MLRSRVLTVNTRLSVILPVFNGDRYVRGAIESVLTQTFGDFELLICDDGSNDKSYEVCLEYASLDGRVRLMRNENNIGLARTMNRLFEASVGEYIAIQEQDDVSERDRFALEVDFLERHPEFGLVSGVAEWVDNNGKRLALFPGLLANGGVYPREKREMVEFLYIDQCKVVNAACMFRKCIAERIPGPYDHNARMSIDWRFFIDIAHLSPIAGLNQILVRMRRGREHASLSKNSALRHSEARRCIFNVFWDYRSNAQSPISLNMLRKSASTEVALEGRSHGRWGMVLKTFLALMLDPGNRIARRTIVELWKRIFQ